MVLAEAMAFGLPVLSANLGSMQGLGHHHQTGLLFHPGDAQDLADQITWILAHPEQVRQMRTASRREYEQKYTAASNVAMLIDIYRQAVSQRG